MSGQAIIETKELTKNYGNFTAVDHLNLSIAEGDIFGFLGPNGAGKTTTILMLLGLTEPTSGSASVSGYNPAREPLKVKSMVGYLPEKVGFYEDLTAKQNLEYTARLNNIPEGQIKALRQIGAKQPSLGTFHCISDRSPCRDRVQSQSVTQDICFDDRMNVTHTAVAAKRVQALILGTFCQYPIPTAGDLGAGYSAGRAGYILKHYLRPIVLWYEPVNPLKDSGLPIPGGHHPVLAHQSDHRA